jgi:asparagine synthetase B (glutamine-hydrolysing)
MCGIVGIISKTRIEKKSIKDIIEKMNNTLIHQRFMKVIKNK